MNDTVIVPALQFGFYFTQTDMIQIMKEEWEKKEKSPHNVG